MIKKKNETDFIALRSPFMRIPNVRVETARALLNLGYKDIFELQGRDPNILFEECIELMPKTQDWILKDLETVVDFAEFGISILRL